MQGRCDSPAKITGRKRAWGEVCGANVLGRDEDGRYLIKGTAG